MRRFHPLNSLSKWQWAKWHARPLKLNRFELLDSVGDLQVGLASRVPLDPPVRRRFRLLAGRLRLRGVGFRLWSGVPELVKLHVCRKPPEATELAIYLHCLENQVNAGANCKVWSARSTTPTPTVTTPRSMTPTTTTAPRSVTSTTTTQRSMTPGAVCLFGVLKK